MVGISIQKASIEVTYPPDAWHHRTKKRSAGLDKKVDYRSQRAPAAEGAGKRVSEKKCPTKGRRAKGNATPTGLEPMRDEPNRFLVDRLNHSAKVSHLCRRKCTLTKMFAGMHNCSISRVSRVMSTFYLYVVCCDYKYLVPCALTTFLHTHSDLLHSIGAKQAALLSWQPLRAKLTTSFGGNIVSYVRMTLLLCLFSLRFFPV